MKKIYCVLAVVLSLSVFCTSLSASGKEEGGSGPYLASKIGDNWFIDAGIGGGVYIGGNNAMNFGNRLGAVLDLSGGKWFTPALGARLSLNHTPAFMESVYGQNWSFSFSAIHADVVWNMFNSFGGYKEKRVYQLIPAFGAGVAIAGNATQFQGHTYSFMLAFSLINKFRVSDLIDINLEMRGIGTKQAQDNFEWKDHTFDCPLYLTAGVSFKIGKQKFERAASCAGSYAAEKAAAEDAIKKLRASNDSLLIVLAEVQNAQKSAGASKDNDAERNALKAENDKLLAELARMNAAAGDLEAMKKILHGKAVFFDRGYTVLKEQEMSSFEIFARFVQQSIADGKKFYLVSSADSMTGTKDVNERMCRERLNYVKNLLVSRYGIAVDDLNTKEVIDTTNDALYAALSRSVYLVFFR